ncbi:lipopolysaccharide biosynthesis protein [Thiolapillus sp.]
MSITREVAHSLKWVTVSKFMAQVIRWGVTFLVIRILNPDDYGLMAMAGVVLSFFEVFASAGLGTALIQAATFSRRQVQEIFGLLLLVNLILALGMGLLAPWAADYYKDERLIPILHVLPFVLMISSLETLPSAMLTREMQFKRRSLAELTASAIAALFTLWLAWQGWGVWALIWGYMSEVTLRALLLNLVNPMLVLPLFRFNHSLPLLSFGGAQTLTTFAWFIFSSMDVFIGGRLWTADMVGIYAVAIQLSHIPLNKLTPIVKQVALPAYAKIHHQPEGELSTYYLKANGLTMLVAFPIFFGLAAVSPVLIPVLLGEKWQSAILPATLLPLILPFRMSQELMDPVLEAIGKPQEALKNWMIIISITAPSLYLGAVWHDILGLCIGWMVSMPLSYILTSRITTANIGVDARAFSKTVFPPLFIAGTMFAVVRITQAELENILPPIPLLLLEINIGALIYLSLAWLFCKREFRSILHILGKLKK